MKKSFRLSMPLVLILIWAIAAPAQVATGTPPFSTIGGGSVDQIDLGNLNIHFCIPIVNKTGRGTPFTYSLCYDSSLWTPYGSAGWTPSTTWGWTTDSPVPQSAASLTGYLTYSQVNQQCYGYDLYGQWGLQGTVTYYQNFEYVDRLGVWHYINYSWQQDQYWGSGGGPGYDDCNEDNNTYYYGDGTIDDGSGYSMDPNSWQIYTASGASLNEPINPVNGGSSTYTDRNGNKITANGDGTFTDTLGKTALTISGSNPVLFSYTAPGGTASYEMQYKSQTVQTSFDCNGVTEYGPHNVPLVSEIDLPDYNATTNPFSRYAFTYDAAARITSITLPTGGKISYSYTDGNSGIECADGTTAGLIRETPDTGSGNPWKYDRTLGTSPSPNVTLITDPYGNQTNMQFQNIYLTEEDDYSGAAGGTPLRTVYNCYNMSGPPPCNNTVMYSAPSGSATFVQWGGSGGIESRTNTYYDWAGNLTEKDEYAYGTPGSGSPGPLTRYTFNYYNGGTPDLLQQALVEDPSNNIIAKTTYTYDGIGPIPTSGTPQHVANVNSGNLTSESVLVSGSTYLTKSFRYYDTGNLYGSTDVNGAITFYGYNACQNSLPTSISGPIGGQSMTWDCNGGVQLTATDQNVQTVTTAYTDANFWRPASVKDQLGNVTSFTYTPYNNGSTPASVEGVMTFNGGSSATDVRATLDKSGRQYVSQVRQTPTSTMWDSAESDYNSSGQSSVTTMPYAAAAGAACSPAPCPGSGTTYDALSRPQISADGGGGTVTYTYNLNDVHLSEGPAPANEHTKDRQMEYDALGRLTSVCEMTTVTSGWTTGPCGQNSPASGYLTKYTYDLNNNLTGVTQNAQSSTNQQTRSYTYDDLSRMTSETNPENGVTNYTYDTDSTCGTSDGDLVKKTDNMGNVTCYAYDALHRVISLTYPSGTYASVTPQKHFTYDSATVNGVAMSNAEGRLAETYTCYSPCSTKLTDEGVSYTVRGEPSDVYQMTPHSGGNYFHVNETYWENGAVKKISGLTGLPAITYNVDGEGRTTTVSAASGQNPVTAAAYQTGNPPGNPTGSLNQVTFGSNDSDTFGYDPNTGRMTKYESTVNSQTLEGDLHWNAAGTLASQTITDGINPADTQTCTYTHDDLSRIAGTSSNPGVNCAQGSSTLLSQYFTYDPFGNINKNVASGSSTTFLPGYSATTNRITSYSCPPTYDADGNATNDCLNNFTWDANGRPTSMGNVGQSSVNLAYDASGNMIEQTSGSATTQIVYAPDGTKLALMNGTSTLVKAFVPLTGGATAVYNSTGLAGYRHSDWLGSARLTSSSASPTQATSETAYGPFGEVYWSSGSDDASFTGMNQDADPNSGIYDFPAREYEMEGRWPSPDPLGIGAVDPTDPQSWNRYAYVRNSPLSLTDPNGMDYEVCVGGDHGYGDSFLPGSCVYYGGSSVDDLNMELGPCMSAVGGDYSGTIVGNGCGGYEGAMIGTYSSDGDNGGGGPNALAPAFDCEETTGGPVVCTPVPNNCQASESSCGIPFNPGQPGSPSGGDSGGVANQLQPPTPCNEQRVLSAIPGASVLPSPPPASVGEHMEYPISITLDQLQADGFAPFSIFGVHNGWRNGGVIMQVHVNGPGGVVAGQAHIDVFNPASGGFGIVAHGLWDLLVGSLLQKLLPHSKGLLDPKC